MVIFYCIVGEENEKKYYGCCFSGKFIINTSCSQYSGVYVGLDIGSSKVDITASAAGRGFSTDDSAGSQTLKVGYYFNENTRTSVYYQNINVDGGDGYSYGAGFDYLIGSSELKPFVGLIVGKSGITDDSNSNLDLEGFSYGGQIGLNYSIADNFSMDLGYRYLKSNADVTSVVSGVNVLIEVDAVTNWYIGANYKF